MSLQLFGPEWTLAAYGGFFREENIIALEERSILCAVWYAESIYPPGRLLILSDNFALVLASAKDAQKHSHCFQSCVGSLRLVSEKVASELNYSDEGSRFFDRDYDPTKSLLHALAQRLARSSPGRTSDQDCFSPSRMHLDAGEVDPTYHTHVPTVGVQSYVQSDDLSNYTGHAAAVSSQSSSTGKNNFNGSLSYASCTPVDHGLLVASFMTTRCVLRFDTCHPKLFGCHRRNASKRCRSNSTFLRVLITMRSKIPRGTHRKILTCKKSMRGGRGTFFLITLPCVLTPASQQVFPLNMFPRIGLCKKQSYGEVPYTSHGCPKVAQFTNFPGTRDRTQDS